MQHDLLVKLRHYLSSIHNDTSKADDKIFRKTSSIYNFFFGTGHGLHTEFLFEILTMAL